MLPDPASESAFSGHVVHSAAAAPAYVLTSHVAHTAVLEMPAFADPASHGVHANVSPSGVATYPGIHTHASRTVSADVAVERVVLCAGQVWQMVLGCAVSDVSK